jgi:hypothetical protein
MILCRLLIYGTLVVLTSLVLLDTNLGRPLTDAQRRSIASTVEYLDSHDLRDEARVASRIVGSNGFRTSRFFANFTALLNAKGSCFAFYAYTPVFSRSEIFLGDTFWDCGDAGRASIIVHELAHIARHGTRVLRGIPRRADEVEAYRRQYRAYRSLSLSSNGSDSSVYWDMMSGVKAYVIPADPQYLRKADVRSALLTLSQEDARPARDTAVILVYLLAALLLLAGGDRLGAHIACAGFGRCRTTPLLHLGPWLLPLALLIPALIFAGFLAILMRTHGQDAIQTLADNLEAMVLAIFLLTGLLGGFCSHTRHNGA